MKILYQHQQLIFRRDADPSQAKKSSTITQCIMDDEPLIFQNEILKQQARNQKRSVTASGNFRAKEKLHFFGQNAVYTSVSNFIQPNVVDMNFQLDDNLENNLKILPSEIPKPKFHRENSFMASIDKANAKPRTSHLGKRYSSCKKSKAFRNPS